MTTALQISNKEVPQFTPDQLKLIRDTIAKNASADELQLFLYRAKSMGLDPLKPGQIHFVKYGTGAGTIVVGVEGFRSIAHRSGKFSGIERGVKRDEKGKITHGWAKVFRSDWSNPAYEESAFAEYDTGRNNWVKMPETMIKKVAECAALRMAFPNELGGVYAPEEMDQAEKNAAQVRPDAYGQPPETDGGQIDKGYRIPFGKFAKRALEEVDPKELENYAIWLESNAQKTGKPLGQMQVEFIGRVEAYIRSIDSMDVDESDVP